MTLFIELTQVLYDVDEATGQHERLKVLIGLGQIVQIHAIFQDGGLPKDGSRSRVALTSREETKIDVEETYTEIRDMICNPGLGFKVIAK